MNFLKDEFNLVQAVKMFAIFLGGTLITFGVLKTAHFAERIYLLLLNKL